MWRQRLDCNETKEDVPTHHSVLLWVGSFWKRRRLIRSDHIQASAQVEAHTHLALKHSRTLTTWPHSHLLSPFVLLTEARVPLVAADTVLPLLFPIAFQEGRPPWCLVGVSLRGDSFGILFCFPWCARSHPHRLPPFLLSPPFLTPFHTHTRTRARALSLHHLFRCCCVFIYSFSSHLARTWRGLHQACTPNVCVCVRVCVCWMCLCVCACGHVCVFLSLSFFCVSPAAPPPLFACARRGVSFISTLLFF